MPDANVIDLTGTSTGTATLPPEIFDVAVHEAVMHQALLRQQANKRQGTHDTKNRSEVSGGGIKPWRQKGTGRARQGSIRAPQWEGGGIVFGPTPRSYQQDMPRKQRRLALRSALSVQAQAGAITVLDDIAVETPQTKIIAQLLTTIKAGRRVLVVLGSHHEVFEKSARNIPEVCVVLASNLSVQALLTAETILITKDALQHVAEAWA